MSLFQSVGSRRAFPLALNTLTTLHYHRIASIDNAAQTLHLVAG
ncbi:hypothetical protein [Candidatus Vallotia cooleyia]|nr:hypothetical protein [Candidatus Vallotia cooleyia]